MDALLSSAQHWVPWAAVACLLVGEAWFRALGLAHAREAPSLLSGYFVCLGLAVALPVAASLVGWVLGGGIAALGPIVLLLEPETVAAQLRVGAFLALPAAAFVIARSVSSESAVAAALGVAAAISVADSCAPQVILAIALAAAALGGFGARALGPAATGAAGWAAFLFFFAYAYAGGGGVIALLVMSVLGGFFLALVAAGNTGVRAPLFWILPVLPALALAALDPSAAAFDLAAAMPAPAIGTGGALVVIFGLWPAITAIFAWLPGLATRIGAMGGAQGAALRPAAFAISLAAGVVLAGLLALALSAGGALYNELHEAGGGAPLLRVETLILQIRSAPFDPSHFWIWGFLVLPLVPAVLQLVAFMLDGLERLADLAGVKAWIAAMPHGAADRIALVTVLRAAQFAVVIAIIVFAIRVAAVAGSAFAGPIEASASQLADLCESAAGAIVQLFK